MERGSPSYYSILGIRADSSEEEIRRAYRKLAMQWHPDKCPSLLGEANRKFQQIQEAYAVLSDQRKRTMYDLGLYDPEEEGFADFLQEMTSLMADVRREEKEYSVEELQSMLREMAQSLETPQQSIYQSPQWFCGQHFNYDASHTGQWGLQNFVE